MAQLNRLLENVGSVVLGKPEVIKLAVVALLAEGHVLIEDVPGVGKTLLARALAASIDCSFRRIQFTPDLLPSDILGSSVYNVSTGEFVFKPGPIFANVILADEINRTTPRTQSALLEAMGDRQVSVEGKTYALDPPFLVLATQNPYEFEGTYVLPESQLDRFMIRLRMGYPIRDEERRILSSHRAGEPVESLRPVLSGDDVLALQRAVRERPGRRRDRRLPAGHRPRDARKGEDLHVGVSTRGALTLYRAAQSLRVRLGARLRRARRRQVAGDPRAGPPRRRQVVPPGRRVRRGRGDHPRPGRPPSSPLVTSSARGASTPRRGVFGMTATERVQRPSESRGVLRRLARRVVLRLWPNQRLRWTREGLVYIAALARPARGGAPRADQPDPAPGGPGRRPDRRLDPPQRGDAPQARGRSPRPRLRLLGRPAGRRLHPRERPQADRGAGDVPRGRPRPRGPDPLRGDHASRRASSSPGSPAGTGPGSAGRARPPGAGSTGSGRWS